MKLNENIKLFRTFRKVTQQDLADAVGKTKSVISNWERGTNQPDVESIEIICKYLNVTPNELFGWDPNPEYEKYKKIYSDIQKKLNELRNERDKINQEISNLSDIYLYDSNLGDKPIIVEAMRSRKHEDLK